jgi:hypothetical protein
MPTSLSAIRKQLISSTPASGEVSIKSSRPQRHKRLMAHGAVGAALMATCLQAGAASALSFNFTFTGSIFGNYPGDPVTVTGIVDGLLDNVNGQNSGLTLTITSATNTPPAGWPVFTDSQLIRGTGFNVSGGVVTGVNVEYQISGVPFLELDLNNTGVGFRNNLSYSGGSTQTLFINANPDNTSAGISFSPVTPVPSSVPGPIPLFGAAAAFGWSRQLRRRIKTLA